MLNYRCSKDGEESFTSLFPKVTSNTVLDNSDIYNTTITSGGLIAVLSVTSKQSQLPEPLERYDTRAMNLCTGNYQSKRSIHEISCDLFSPLNEFFSVSKNEIPHPAKNYQRSKRRKFQPPHVGESATYVSLGSPSVGDEENATSSIAKILDTMNRKNMLWTAQLQSSDHQKYPLHDDEGELCPKRERGYAFDSAEFSTFSGAESGSNDSHFHHSQEIFCKD